MVEFKNTLRKLRVYKYLIETASGMQKQILVIDRESGEIREQFEAIFEVRPIQECRPRNIGLLLHRQRQSAILTGCDVVGFAITDMLRILNQTGFRGQLLFLCDESAIPLHTARRMKNLALDFDLGSVSVTNLVKKVNEARDITIPRLLASALG